MVLKLLDEVVVTGKLRKAVNGAFPPRFWDEPNTSRPSVSGLRVVISGSTFTGKPGAGSTVNLFVGGTAAAVLTAAGGRPDPPLNRLVGVGRLGGKPLL